MLCLAPSALAQQTTYAEDFQRSTVAGAVSGWADSTAEGSEGDSFYRAWTDPLDSNNLVYGFRQIRRRAVGAARPAGSLAGTFSTYTRQAFTAAGRFEFRGRFLRTNANARIGLTFFSSCPDIDRYDLIGLTEGSTMRLAAQPAHELAGISDSSFLPEPNRWVRFFIQAEEIGGSTILRARFWNDGTPEPSTFSIDAADAAAGRLSAGRIGIWSVGGDVYVDDLSASSSALDVNFVEADTNRQLDPFALAAFKSAARINVVAEGDFTAKLDGHEYVNGSPIAEDGFHDLTVSTATGQITLRILIDSKPPLISLLLNGALFPEGQAVDHEVTLSANVKDVSSVTLAAFLDGVPVVLPMIVSEEITHHVSVRAVDQVGWESVAAATFTIAHSEPATELTILAPRPNLCTNASAIDVSGRVVGARVASVKVTLASFPSVAVAVADDGSFAAEILAPAEGKFDLVVEAANAAVRIPVSIDRTKPAVEITSGGAPFAGGSFNRPVALFVRAIDADPTMTLDCKLNEQPFATGTPVTADGSFTLRATASDCAGNTSEERVAHFVIDRIPPRIVGLDPADGASITTSHPAIHGSVDSDDLQTIVIDGVGSAATISGRSFTFSSATLAEGTNRLTIEATDRAGNVTRLAYTLGVKTTTPTVSIVENGSPIPENALFNRPVTPVIRASEPGATIAATLNGAPFISGTTITADGGYTLSASVSDQSGHTSEAAIATFGIDRTPPAISITAPVKGASLSADHVDVHVTASGADAVSVNGIATVASGSEHVATVPLESGANLITATANDRAGNHGVDQIEVTRTDSPGIILTLPADNSLTNRTVTAVAGQVLTAARVAINGNEVPVDAAGAFHLDELALSEGANEIAAAVVGGSARAAVHVTADFTPPRLRVLANDIELKTGDRFAKSPNIAIDASDERSTVTATVIVDGAAGVPASLADGGHSLIAIARDAAGNETRVDRTFVVGGAGAGPCAIFNLDPSDGSSVFASSVRLAGRAGGTAEVVVDGTRTAVAGGSFAMQVPLTREGANSIDITCADSSGSVTLTLYRVTGAPSITIDSPTPHTTGGAESIAVTGTVSSDAISGDINGIPFTPDAGKYSLPNVPLSKGPNIIVARARNGAGRVGIATRYVIRTGTPRISITSPITGSQTALGSTEVSGTWAWVDPQTLAIAGSALSAHPISDTTGIFVASSVAVTGSTTIAVTGRSPAGESVSASVDLQGIAGLPEIRVDAPPDNTYLPPAQNDVAVSGSIAPIGGSVVQVNGAQVAIDAGSHFSANAALTATGVTPVMARVVIPDGSASSDNLRLVHLGPLVVKETYPIADAREVDPGVLLLILFSNPIDAASARAAVSLTDSSKQGITTTVFVDDDTVSAAPAIPLVPGTTYTLTVSNALKDAAGSALAQPLSFTFTTAASAPAAPPIIDQSDTAGCIEQATITGTAMVAGARVRLDLDGVSTSVAAGADRKFIFELKLSGQTGYHIARIREVGADGTLSPEATVAYRISCDGPQVLSASLDRTAKKLAIQFSKPVDASTLLAAPGGTIILAAFSGAVTLDGSGQSATVSYDSELGTSPLVLTVTRGVKDLSGMPMAADYTQTFAAASEPRAIGEGWVSGAVYDASSGRPLPNAAITVGASTGSTDDRGHYTIPLSEGVYPLAADARGFATAWRQVVVRAGAGTVPLDFRLARRSAEQTMAGTPLLLADGPVQLSVPVAALASGKRVALTLLSAQSLAAPLPLGWSPAAAAEIAVDGSPLAVPLSASKLTIALLHDIQQATLVQYDPDRIEWRVVAAVVPVNDGNASIDLLTSGNYALVYPDSASALQQPLPPHNGASLEGVADPCEASPDICRPAARSFVLDPPAVAPNGRTVATLVADGAKPYPSGTAVQATIDEQLNLADGRTLNDPPFTTDLLLYRTPAGDTASTSFSLAPSSQAVLATLRDGVDRIIIAGHPGRIDRAAMIGSEGGRVSAGDRISIDIPTGATLDPIRVTATPLTDFSSFGTIAGFQIAGGFTLSLPHTLLKSARVTQTVTAASQAIVAEVLEETAFGRVIRIAATSHPLDLPLDGLVRSGTFLILTPDVPIAFTFGRVRLGSGGTPLPDALVVAEGLGVGDVSRVGGVFVLPVQAKPAAPFALHARANGIGDGAPARNPIAPDADAVVPFGDLILVAQPPHLISLTPADSSILDPGAPFQPQAMFDVPLDASSAGQAIVVNNLTTGAMIAGVADAAGNILTFHPAESLQPQTRYSVTILPGLRSSNGAPFGRTAVSRFSTRNIPAANGAINTDRIRITIPDANGISVISGRPGALPAGSQAVAVRRISAFIEQFQTTTAADGSFSFNAGGGDDAIAVRDAIDLHVIDGVSHATIAVIALTPFTTADGRGFLAPPDAEVHFSTSEGIKVNVPAGAFDTPTLVTATPSSAEAFANVPSFANDLTYITSVNLQFDGIAGKRLDIELPMPSGTAATKPFYLGYLGQSIRGPRVMICGTLRAESGHFTTVMQPGVSSAALKRAPNALTDVNAAMLGIVAGGTYAAVNFAGAAAWALFDGIPQGVDLFWDSVPSLYASALYVSEGHGRVVVPVQAGRRFEVSGDEAATGLGAFRRVYDPLAAGDPADAMPMPSPIDNQLGPYPVFASPARVEIVDLPAGGVTLTSVRDLSMVLDNGILRVSGQAGGRIEVLNTSNGNLQVDDDFTAGHTIAMSAAVGDRIVLLIGERNADPASAISIAFNEPIYFDGDPDTYIHDHRLFKVLASGADITPQVHFEADSGNRRITVRFENSLQLGKRYRIVISRDIADAAGAAGAPDLRLGQRRNGSQLSDDLHLDFTTRASGGAIASYDLASGSVRDLAMNGNVALVAALNGGVQALDVSDPAMPHPLGSVAAGVTEFWAITSDHHGRVYTTGLTNMFGVLRTYRLEDFVAGGNPPLRGSATLSWRPGLNTNVPLGTETVLGNRPEATPRKLQIALQDDEPLRFTPATLIAAFGGSATNLGGGFQQVAITIRGDRTIPYQTQRVTIENRTLELHWSVDVPRSGSASIAAILARDGDELFLIRNRSTYAVVSLFGYGVSVIDVNAVESNEVSPAEPDYRTLQEQVALSNGADPVPMPPCDPARSAATGAPCPIRDLAFSPEALIRPTATSALIVFALDAGRGVLDLNVGLPSLVTPAGGGLTLASALIDHPRLHTLRRLYQTASGLQPFGHFTSIASYGDYALIAANQFGLLVVRLNGGALDWDALADVVWIPAGAYAVRVMEQSDVAVVTDGAGRVLLVDLKKIDESSQVSAIPACSNADCLAELFPTARKSITSAPSLTPGADWVEVGADDPRILWKSGPHLVHGTLAPLVDPSTGFVFTGDVNTAHMNVVAAFDPRLHVVVNTGPTGLAEVLSIVPLGIDPPPNRVSGPNGSLAAFRVEANFPANIANGDLNFAVESERMSGAAAAQTPIGFPPAALRLRDPVRPSGLRLFPTLPAQILAQFPVLRLQRGANRFASPWVIALGDPRASKEYIWPAAADKRAAGCLSCDRPAALQNDPSVLEMWSAGDFLVIRPDGLPPAYSYLERDHRLEARLGSIGGDLLRPSDGAVAQDRLVTKNLPASGTMYEHVVNLNTTEVQHAKTDLAIKGRGIDFVLTRFYGSAVDHLGPFGRNFDSPLFARVRKLPNGDVEFYDGTGRRDVFSGGAVPPNGIFLDMRQIGGGRIVVQEPDNTRLYFDSSGRLTKITDKNTTTIDGTDGNAITFVYDAAGRLATVVDPVARVIRFQYNDSDLIESVSDFDGRSIAYSYDSQQRLIKVEGPDPQSPLSAMPVTTYMWGTSATAGTERDIYASGQLISESDALQRTIWTVHYADPDPWSAERLESGGGSWSFERNNDATAMTDPNGNVWKYMRDADRRVTAVVDPAGATTTYAFDSDGRLASVTRPLGDQTTYAHANVLPNGDHRPMANVTAMTEIPRSGSPERAANLSRVTDIHYGPANLPISITAPEGSTTTIARDARGNPQSITDAAGITTNTTYDNHGLLVTSDDPRSGASTFEYDANGNPKSVTTSAGTTAIVNDARGNVLQVTDPSGRSAGYTFNKLDQLESESRGSSLAKSSYDAAGNLSKREVLAGADASGNPINSTTTLTVDEVGRIRSQTDNGRQTTTTYDTAGNVTHLESAGTAPVSYVYDSRGRISTLTIGGQTSTHTYDDNGQPLNVRDARGNTTTFLTGGFGQTVGQTNAAGVTTSITTDAANRPVDERVIKTNTNGSRWILRWTTREYDALGRMTKETRKLFTAPLPIPANGQDPVGATDVVTRWLYDDAHRTVTIVDPNGNQTYTENDDLGRPTRSVDAVGTETRIVWNPDGTKASETVAELSPDRSRNVFTTVYDYDDQNRMISVTDTSDSAHPIATHFEYDVRGNRMATTDPDGNRARYEYDIRSRLTKTIDPEGGETSRGYDDADRLVSRKDPNGNETKWTWNAEGNLESEKRADGATWGYTYDRNHNLETVTDPDGTVTTLIYDSLDRVIEKRIACASGVVGPSLVRYTLDDLGRITATETDEGVKESFSYDSLDRNLTESVEISGSPRRSVTRVYDAASNVTSLTYPSGLTISQNYDALNRLASIDGIARYRDAGARLVEKSLANGVTQTWSWDANARLQAIASQAAEVRYKRSLSGLKTGVIRPDLGRRWNYLLDRNGSITREALLRTDPKGDQLVDSTDYVLDRNFNYQSIGKTQTVINSRNQYAAFGSSNPTWDPNGNLRSLGGIALQYDSVNHLSRARRGDGQTVIEITYAGSGRKVQEKSGSVTRQYMLDGSNVAEEYVNGSLDARYVHGRGVDEIARADVGTATIYPLQDELGNVERLTGANGSTIQRYQYEGYGQFQIFAQTTTPVTWRWLFQGREYQPLLDAYDFRARTLWPELDRFGQEDLAGGSGNLYETFQGNWANNTDPSGQVVVMMHGIRSHGGDWANAVAQGLAEEWDRKGADSGQDVINLANWRERGIRFPGGNPGEYDADNATRALGFGYLDEETKRAGDMVAVHLNQLRAVLNASKHHIGEPLQVLAHSHGTSMLLAAARVSARSNTHATTWFHLKSAVLVGSDLERHANISALLRTAGTVYNFFSSADEWVAIPKVEGAGGVGFQGRRLVELHPNLLGGRDVIQKELPGIKHTGDPFERQYGRIPWLSRQLAMRYYAPIFELRDARPAGESQSWLDTYQTLRNSMGLQQWMVDLPAAFNREYSPSNR